MRAASILVFASVLSCLAGKSTYAEDFNVRGLVAFGNLQATLLFQGASSPYLGKGISPQIGLVSQTGSILPDPSTVDLSRLQTEGILVFEGNQGPNPFFGGRSIHVIQAKGGQIFCEWHAVFTAQFSTDGTVVLSGDGEFTIVGGTGRYRRANGTFRTLFQTGSVPSSTDSALARFTQTGQWNRK